jgi:hypothetical protein
MTREVKPKLFVLTVLFLSLGWMGLTRAENATHLQQLRQTNQCPNCDLSGVNLSRGESHWKQSHRGRFQQR